MKISRTGKSLADQLRTDDLAVFLDEAAVGLVREENMGNAGNCEWVENTADNRRGECDQNGDAKIRHERGSLGLCRFGRGGRNSRRYVGRGTDCDFRFESVRGHFYSSLREVKIGDQHVDQLDPDERERQFRRARRSADFGSSAAAPAGDTSRRAARAESAR